MAFEDLAVQERGLRLKVQTFLGPPNMKMTGTTKSNSRLILSSLNTADKCWCATPATPLCSSFGCHVLNATPTAAVLCGKENAAGLVCM